MKFFLVGMPGCGKSTFGRRLSRDTGYKLIDLDIEIVSYAGKTISDIFESEGEERFREIESGLLKNLTRENDDFIMATGGGAPCFFDNMDFMNTQGITFYIEVTPEDLNARLTKKGIKKRPLLKHLDSNTLLSELRNKLDSRSPFYIKSRYTFLFHDHLDQDMAPIMKSLILEKKSK